MAVCPQCGNSLEQDFGVVSCSQCQAVLFIDMDGNVHFSGENQQAQADSPNENVTAEAPVGFSVDSQEPLRTPDYADNWLSNDPSQESSNEAFPQSSEVTTNREVEAEFSEAEESAPESETQSELDIGPVPVAGNDFSDVENFANSNSTVGPLSYSVIIEDINTKETRAELKDALTDSKFQWDASELMNKIKGGRLILENLNPVKASVLIHRIRELKVKISWRQNIYG